MQLQQQLEELTGQGWTIEAIACVLEVDRESVSRWLHGGPSRVPTIVSLALEHPAFRNAQGWGKRPPVAEAGRTFTESLGALVERGWTLTALAEVLGVRRDQLSRWYHGLKPERPKMLVLALRHPTVQKQRPPKKRRYGAKRSY